MSTSVTTSALGIRLTRKVRSDAKLERLSAGQRERLRVWLEDENRTYADVVARVRAEFGLCVGKSAVGVYYQRHIAAEPYGYDPDVEAAAVLAAQPLERFSKTMLHRAKALAFALLARPDPQINAATRLLKVVHRVEWQAIRRQRLALQVRRAALRAEFAVSQTDHQHLTASAITPATPAPSRKSSQNSPPFPTYSSLVQPSHNSPPSPHEPVARFAFISSFPHLCPSVKSVAKKIRPSRITLPCPPSPPQVEPCPAFACCPRCAQ